MKPGFKIRTISVRSGPYAYQTHKLTGRLNGERVRKNFKTYAEALGEKNRLEVMAANASGAIRAAHTRLSESQLADAENAFARIGGRSLGFVVDWFLSNYAAPVAEVTIGVAATAFLAERGRHVRARALRDYRRTLARFGEALPGRTVDTVGSSEVQKFLEARKVGPKRWNNLRGDLHAFFTWCGKQPRAWCRSNPVSPVPVFKIARGVPEIISAETARALMAYVEEYAGGERSGLPKGVLVPYFALTLFAGLRPSVPDGEVCKLGRHPAAAKLIDLPLGVIRITPEIAKTNEVRQVTIQPNLAAWLAR